MKDRKVVGHVYGIGHAEYQTESEEESRIIERFLQSMNHQGVLGYWHQVIYERSVMLAPDKLRQGDAQ